MIGIKLQNVFKSYGSKEILHGINTEFPSGKVTVILGASGAGKTTLARLIAGLEKVNSGEIHFNGDVVSSKKTHVEPQNRKVAFLFQDLALLPHMNVQKNLETVLKAKKIDSQERKQIITKLLSEFSLSGKETRSIDELSGGEKQRVAIVRALLQNPQILILDEPFSAIDTELKEEISNVISQTIEKYQLTTLIITHNHEEALQFADNLLILENGKIIDSGKPIDIYNSPKSEKSARIFKQPERKWKSQF